MSIPTFYNRQLCNSQISNLTYSHSVILIDKGSLLIRNPKNKVLPIGEWPVIRYWEPMIIRETWREVRHWRELLLMHYI